MDKRKIIELDIDVEAIIAKSASLKTELDKAREAQAALKKAGDTSSDTYVQISAKVSKLSGEYNMNQKQLVNLLNANREFLTVNEKISLALDQQNKSITDAKNNNAELKKIRNELNIADENHLEILNELNAKIDANDKFIKENVSELEKQKIGIGDYTSAIKDAVAETGLFGGELKTIGDALKQTSSLFVPLKNGIVEAAKNMRNAADGTEGMTASQKALTIATNLGAGAMRIFSLVLAATGIGLIVVAIALLISYFKTFDPLVDKIEQGMAAFGAAIRVVQQALASLFDSSQDSGKAFSDLGDNMAKAARDAAKLKAAQQDLADLQNSQEVANAKAAQQYDELIVKSKNRTLTEKERIAFLQKAEAIETANYKQRSANAQAALDQAIEAARIKGSLSSTELENLKRNTIAYGTYLLNLGKITDEELKMLKEAELGKIAIDAESTKRLEKNQNAQDKLYEDAQAKREKAAQDALEAEKKRQEALQKILDDDAAKAKAELELFISQQGIRAKSLAEALKYEEQIRDKKLQIAQLEFDATKKTEIDKLKLLTDQNNIKNDFLRAQANVVITIADQELQAFLANNKIRLDANKFLTDELVAQEIDRLNRISEAEAAFQTKRLEEGQINAEEYNSEIKAIDDRFAEEKKALEEEKRLAEIDRRAIDLENKIAINQEDLDLKIQKLEQERLIEIKAAEKNGASIELINKKYAKSEVELRKEVELVKLQVIAKTLSEAAGLFKENTVAFKALAIAEATINTLVGATRALKDYAYPLGGIVAGVTIATGFATVAKISGLKLAKGAVDLDGPGTGTSDSIPAMLSKGESVITAKATANNRDLLRAMNANAGIDFSSQFLPSSVVNMYKNTQTTNAKDIDYDLLAAKVAEANKSLPAPKVAVTDINYEQGEYLRIVDGADLWT
ncbi:hypothetical protein [Flavobacterium sp. N2038]|uniref:hypothetical protein n=1 Tax=Flavobacterium sp. N2038 TaxID=2986829 RepID=UPI002225AE94|nr:hypothetical protein [Flavobacterium sp. N2038]